MAGFVLIPLLGTERSLILLATLGAVVSGGLLRAAAPRAFRVLAPAGAVLFAALVWLTPGIYRAVFSRFGDPVLWYEEGLEQTVTILQGPTERRMFLNGWHQANDSRGMVQFHSLLGELPVLLQPAPGAGALPTPAPAGGDREVLVIGLGGGATAGAAAAFPRTHLDVVELSGSVVRGARFFDHVNGGVVAAPNVRVRTDDGRNYLLLTAAALRRGHGGRHPAPARRQRRPLLARVLLPGPAGAQAGRGDDSVDRPVPAGEPVPHAAAHLPAGLPVRHGLGGRVVRRRQQPPLPARPRRARRAPGLPRPGAARAAGLSTPEDVLHLFTATDEELRRYAGDGPIVTDDHPYIEFFRSLPADPHAGRPLPLRARPGCRAG